MLLRIMHWQAQLTQQGHASPRAGVGAPMLLKRVQALPNGDGWFFEVKWDGDLMQAFWETVNPDETATRIH